MKEVILIGTNHLDTKGPERLKKILEKEKPEIIALGCLKGDIEKATRRREEIKREKLARKHARRKIKFTPFTQSQIPKINKETLEKILSIISFELITAKKYATKNNIEIIYLGRKEHINEYFKKNPCKPNNPIHHFNMLKKEAFEFSPKTFQKGIDYLYTLEDECKAPQYIQKAKGYATKEILKIKNKKTAYINGMDLFFKNSPNMYEILKEKGCNVKRLRLIEADNL